MNLQIFGTKKSADTRKAERFFKERGVKFQAIDLKEKGLSRGELRSVAQAAGGLNALIDPDGKDKDLLALLNHLLPDQLEEKLLERPEALRQPIVRDGRRATVGYAPEIWKNWLAQEGR